MPTLSTIGAACARAWGFTSGLVKDQYFNLVSLLLPGNGTNGKKNNDFVDSSSNNFFITPNGDVTQGTFSPFSQTGWGNYFDGTGDYLTVAYNASTTAFSGNFCIQVFVYFNAAPNSKAFGMKIASAGNGSNNGWYLTTNSSNILQWASYGSGPTLTGTTAIVANQWYHIAAVRSGANFSIYLNGNREATTSSGSAAIANSASTALFLGTYSGDASNSSHQLNGYMSNYQTVNGSPVYDPTSTTITVPTAPLTAISGTSLLTCQSNRFVDNAATPNTITATGGTAITPFSPFAPTSSYSAAAVGGSGYFDGSGDFLTAADNAAFTLGSSDFTIEAWVYALSSGTTDRYFIAHADNATAAGSSFILYIFSGNSKIYFDCYVSSSTTSITSDSAIVLNQWNHVAICRSGGTLAMFVNGTRQASPASISTSSINNCANSLSVGARTTGGSTYTGYLSSSRMVVGTDIYGAGNSTITVPTAPLTAVSNTQLLLNFTNAGVVDATAKNVLETEGNAQISTAQSKWGGGSMYFDGSSSFARAPATPNYFIRSGDFTVELWLKRAATGSVQELFSKESATASQAGIRCVILSGNTIQVSLSTDGFAYALTLTGATALTSTSDWYYIALVRSGSGTNNIKLYVNGSVDAQGTFASALYETNTFWALGSRADLTTNTLNGYIDDFRVTVGRARTITSAPTAPFPVQ